MKVEEIQTNENFPIPNNPVGINLLITKCTSPVDGNQTEQNQIEFSSSSQAETAQEVIDVKEISNKTNLPNHNNLSFRNAEGNILNMKFISPVDGNSASYPISNQCSRFCYHQGLFWFPYWEKKCIAAYTPYGEFVRRIELDEVYNKILILYKIIKFSFSCIFCLYYW